MKPGSRLFIRMPSAAFLIPSAACRYQRQGAARRAARPAPGNALATEGERRAGRTQPEPDPVTVEAGKEYRLRLINIHRDATIDITLSEGAEPLLWRPLAKDGAEVPPASRMERPARVRMGVGETYDFLWTPVAPGEAMLRVHVPFPTWPGSVDVRQPIRVR